VAYKRIKRRKRRMAAVALTTAARGRRILLPSLISMQAVMGVSLRRRMRPPLQAATVMVSLQPT